MDGLAGELPGEAEVTSGGGEVVVAIGEDHLVVGPAAVRLAIDGAAMGGGRAEFEANALGGADVVVPPLAAFGGDFELAEAEAGEVGLGPIVGGLEDGIAEAGGPGLLRGEVEDAVTVRGREE